MGGPMKEKRGEAADSQRGRPRPGDDGPFPAPPHLGAADPVRAGGEARAHPGVRPGRVHCGGGRRACGCSDRLGERRLMGRRRSRGSVRRLPSGRWQIRYTGPDGLRRSARATYPTKADANRALSLIDAEIIRGTWVDPSRDRHALADYAARWVQERPGLSPRTVERTKGRAAPSHRAAARSSRPSFDHPGCTRVASGAARRWRWPDDRRQGVSVAARCPVHRCRR